MHQKRCARLHNNVPMSAALQPIKAVSASGRKLSRKELLELHSLAQLDYTTAPSIQLRRYETLATRAAATPAQLVRLPEGERAEETLQGDIWQRAPEILQKLLRNNIMLKSFLMAAQEQGL